MNAIDRAIRTIDRNGVHRLTYKDVDGNKVTEVIQGEPDKVNRRADELKVHGCKILKTEMFMNWR